MKGKDVKLITRQQKLKRRGITSKQIYGWSFLLPMVIVLYLFVWRSTALGFFWSFFKMQGYSVKEFCGFENYIRVITHSQFMPLLWNTIQYVFWSLIIGYLPPLFFAIMLNEMVHFKSGFRILTYMPVVIPGIASLLMWKFMYYPDQSGLLNAMLGKIGIAPYEWLADPKFTIVGIIIYSTWKGCASAMLLYYAALQGTSVELYEAALIDGAGPFKRLWHVTRPSIEGILLLNLVTQIISVFQILNEPLAMTGGGPNGASASLGFQLYTYGFNSAGKGTGRAMALGVIMFLILIVFTIFYFWLNRKVESRY